MSSSSSTTTTHTFRSEYREVARVVFVLIFAFFVAIVNQLVVKVQELKAARLRNERFVRWAPSNMRMLTADRLVGNLVEWGFIFWPLFAAAVLLYGPQGAHVMAGLLYAIARLGYVVVGAGFSRVFPSHGNMHKTPLMAFTTPAYLCLLYLAGKVFVAAL